MQKNKSVIFKEVGQCQCMNVGWVSLKIWKEKMKGNQEKLKLNVKYFVGNVVGDKSSSEVIFPEICIEKMEASKFLNTITGEEKIRLVYLWENCKQNVEFCLEVNKKKSNLNKSMPVLLNAVESEKNKDKIKRKIQVRYLYRKPPAYDRKFVRKKESLYRCKCKFKENLGEKISIGLHILIQK